MKNQFKAAGLVVAIALSIAPVPFAFAYLSPGEVFDIGLPPNKREAKDEATAAAKKNLRDKKEAQGNLVPTINENPVSSSSASSVSPLIDTPHAAAGQSSSTSSVRLDLLTDEGRFQRREDRTLDQQPQFPVIYIQDGKTTIKDAQGRVLHSGAPRTASTGPADSLAILALFVAGTLTFVWAQKRQRGLVEA